VSWGVLHGAMLLALSGMVIPVLIHFLGRRQEPVVDWGAMAFLELESLNSRRLRLQEWLLLLARMGLLGLVALALARPYWDQEPATSSRPAVSLNHSRQNLILIIDGSASMLRRQNAGSPWEQAIAWAQAFLDRLEPESIVTLLLAGERVTALTDPATTDRAHAQAALRSAQPAAGSSDLGAALARAFEILEESQDRATGVIVLTDGQRFAWRPEERARWALLRVLANQLPAPPTIWAVTFSPSTDEEPAPNGSVGPLELSRSLWAAGGSLPIVVNAEITNHGPGSLRRIAELLIDGTPALGSGQPVGPVAAGGRVTLSFQATVPEPGFHVLTVRLDPAVDPLPEDDQASSVVEVTDGLKVLLVDGQPGRAPWTGQTDFVRAALMPSGNDAAGVQAKVVAKGLFRPDDLDGARVVVLADLDHLDQAQQTAIEAHLRRGRGMLVAPGQHVDPAFYNDVLYQAGQGWLPAKLGPLEGSFARAASVARPAPQSFRGSFLASFGTARDAPLGNASLFAYWKLDFAAHDPASTVLARLDTGAPWFVEGIHGAGRVILLAGPLGADGGTLPVNPDFVPWLNELVFHLAGPAGRFTRTSRPGLPITLDLDPPPAKGILSIPVQMPSGARAGAKVSRSSGHAQALFEQTNAPGAYRFERPSSGPLEALDLVVVEADRKESDLAPLGPSEQVGLAAGWRLVFEPSPAAFMNRLLTRSSDTRQEVWRGLMVAALVLISLEVALTRRLSRAQERVE
jgi:hypothetical protein